MKHFMILVLLLFSVGVYADDIEEAKKALNQNDFAKAYEIANRSCTFGNPEGCVLLGHLYQEGLGVTIDMQKAIQLFRFGCDKNFVVACGGLGEIYEVGIRGIKQDFFKAIEYYEKGCNGGDLSQCVNLGNLYGEGQGVKQDFFKAFEYYEKSCNKGNSMGCNNLGAMYKNGQSVKQNSKKALELFGKACEMKSNKGCNNYAILKKQMGL